MKQFYLICLAIIGFPAKIRREIKRSSTILERWQARQAFHKPHQLLTLLICWRHFVRKAKIDFPGSFWIIALGYFVNGLATFVAPYLTLYLTKEHHFSDSQAGGVASMIGLGALISSGFSWLSDRYGRKPILGISMILLAMDTILIGMVGIIPLYWIWGLTLCQGFFWGIYRPTMRSLIPDVVGPFKMSMASNVTYWIFNLGIGSGMFLSGIALAAHVTFSSLFFTDASTTLLVDFLVVVGVRKLKSLRANVAQEGQIQISADFAFWRNKQFLLFLFVSFLEDMIYSQYQSTWPLFAKASVSPVEYAFAAAVNGVVVVVVGWVHIPEKWPSYRMLALSSLLTGAGFFTPVLVGRVPIPAVYLLVFGASLWTLGEIVMAQIGTNLISRFGTEAGASGMYQGVGLAPSYLASVLGPWIGTAIYEHFGLCLWVGCLIGGLVSAGLYLETERNLIFVKKVWPAFQSVVLRPLINSMQIVLLILVVTSAPVPASVRPMSVPPRGVYQVDCHGTTELKLYLDNGTLCFAGKGNLILKKQYWIVNRIDLFGSPPAWVSYSSGTSLPRAYSQMVLKKGANLVPTNIGIPQVPINAMHIGTLPVKHPPFTQGPYAHEVFGDLCTNRDDFSAQVTIPLLGKDCFANAGEIHPVPKQAIAFASGVNQVQYVYLSKDGFSYTEFDLDRNQTINVAMLFPGVPAVPVTNVHIN